VNGTLVSTNVEYQRWGTKYFKYQNQTEVNLLGINNAYCSTDRNFLIQGNSLSEDFLYIELLLTKCSGSGCPADLNSKISKMKVEVPVVNTFFNFDDYQDPVKTYIDGRFSYDLLPGYVKTNYVFLKKNEAEYQDSYWAYQPGGNKKEFVGIERVDQRLAVQDDAVDDVIFRMHRILLLKIFCNFLVTF